ncbi:hypothetical protein [Lysinibacillus piscis]|uniref:Spore coat protein n=1 Tax=Lysinibacillus piscis TaxID=2518931 RepID=A0ABQ5NJY7_9BACI|nr:hypothetical protein [Lysinibacillus sp. KH24]GLC88604.1 hypothetical protein LYSBPC_17310 [Lysinibacillus sp. KH24]
MIEDQRYTSYMNGACCKKQNPTKPNCPSAPKLNIRCKSCICAQLHQLAVPTVLDLFLSNGSTFLGVTFIGFNNKNCCASFLEAGSTTPLIIDCNKIDAIRKAA